jgi:ceramide glucosyltransferase
MALDWLILFSWLLLGASVVGCLYLGYASLAVRRFARRLRPRTMLAPPVSVLKPLCGEDPDLYENLRSFCRQEYPTFQIVFGVRDPADPAVPIVRRLIAEFPAADLSLVVDGRQRGGNLKVANLRNMLPAARHPVLVLADSDMRVAPGYLAEVIAPLDDPATGLVTCLYRGISAGGAWSDLACLHVNHGFLPQAVVGETLGGGAGGCFGATLALRRDTLEAAGGFAAIADALADDHALGVAVRRLRQRVVLSPHVVDNVIHEPSLAALFRHELRWARTIRLLAPAGFAGSVITYPVVLAALATALQGLPVMAPAMLGIALVCRWVTAWLMDRALRLPSPPVWLLPARDLLSFAVFVASFFTRTVAWRDRTFRVGRDGQLTLDGDSPA